MFTKKNVITLYFEEKGFLPILRFQSLRKNGKILQNLEEHQYSIVKLHLICLLYSVRIYLALIAYYHINGFQNNTYP